LKIVDGGLAGTIFLVPWIMGGRDAIGQLVLAVFAVAILVAWSIRQTIRGKDICRPAWLIVPVLAGATFLLLQTIPLPTALLEWIAPRHAELLPLWKGEAAGTASLGSWASISFTPAETRGGLVLFLSYAILFVTTVQRVRELKDIQRILRWCALSALIMGAFGIIQYLAGNGKFFWFFQHPYADTLHDAKGSFTNRNHFAHFLALGIGPMIWWLYHSTRQEHSKTSNGFKSAIETDSKNHLKTPLIGLALAVVIFAGALSLSRGGMGAVCLAVAVAAAFCFASSAGIGKVLGTLAATVVLIVSALSIFGLDRVAPRVESALDIANQEKDWSNGRFAIWKNTLTAIPNFLWTGAGAGSYCEVYPIYDDGSLSDAVEVTHAECSYLNCLLETGIFGLAALLACLGCCGYWCIACWKSDSELKTCAGAIVASLCVCAAQALIDFVWYVPSCVAMMTILAACAWPLGKLSLKLPRKSLPPTVPRWASLVAVGATLMLGAWMIDNRLGPALAEPDWNRYLVAEKAATDREQNEKNKGTPLQSQYSKKVEIYQQLIGYLENVIDWDPNHARAHLALAETHVKLFDTLQKFGPNRMSVISIRDAARNANFETRDALFDWLHRAVGDSLEHLTAALKHSRRSLELCPLQGQGYIYLAELGFLEGNRVPAEQDCIRQALLVRSNRGDVIFAAASEALLAGDESRWLELANKTYRRGAIYQRRLIEELIGRTPTDQIPAMIDLFLDHFPPDCEGLAILHQICAARCPPEQLNGLFQVRAQLAEWEAAKREGNSAALLWLAAQSLRRNLGENSQALLCARKAVQCDPNFYSAHYQYAVCLLQQKKFAEAEPELEWCRGRRPGDKNLDSLTKEVIKSRLNAERDETDPVKRF
jgi:O-antigen ligase/tetratricopeptide (TPR) repeat protein